MDTIQLSKRQTQAKQGRSHFWFYSEVEANEANNTQQTFKNKETIVYDCILIVSLASSFKGSCLILELTDK